MEEKKEKNEIYRQETPEEKKEHSIFIEAMFKFSKYGLDNLHNKHYVTELMKYIDLKNKTMISVYRFNNTKILHCLYYNPLSHKLFINQNCIWSYE